MTNFKFKIGDRVKIIKSKSFINKDFVGLVGTINGFGKRYFTKDDAYDIKFDIITPASEYWWVDEELELVEAKPFTKSDLKDGMIVEYRNGRKAMCLNGRFVSYEGNMELADYTDVLTRVIPPVLYLNNGKAAYDIMKVYKTPHVSSLQYILNVNSTDLIWERKEEPKHKEMTVEEIEKKLGYKIKVIADK